MIRTGRGPYLSSVGIGIILAIGFPLAALVFLAIVAALLVCATALLIAAPIVLVVGACGLLHLEDDSCFVEDMRIPSDIQDR